MVMMSHRPTGTALGGGRDLTTPSWGEHRSIHEGIKELSGGCDSNLLLFKCRKSSPRFHASKKTFNMPKNERFIKFIDYTGDDFILQVTH